MNDCRIILADDHVLFRAGLKKIIEEQHNLKVIGEAGNGIELLDLLKTFVPDVIILDLSMPNFRGLDAIPLIKSQYPAVKVLVLTMHKDRDYLRQALSVGADGYMLKEDADPELFSAIEAIRQGGQFVSPGLADDMADDLDEFKREGAFTSFRPEALTSREKEILALIAAGRSNKEIADTLFISARTVERHRANLMSKLDTRKIADLVKYALQNGYV